MKTLKKNTGIVSFLMLVALPAYAADPAITGPVGAASRLEYGETFVLQEQPKIEFSYKYTESENIPKVEHCSNTLLVTPNFTWGFIQYSLNPFPIYATKGMVDARLTNFRLFDSSDYKCDWNQDRLTQEIEKVVGPYRDGTLKIVLDRVGQDGTEIYAHFNYKNAAFVQNQLTNGQSQLSLPGKLVLSECTDSRGEKRDAKALAALGTGGSFEAAIKSNRVDSMISALREQEFLELTHCRFQVLRNQVPAEFVKDLKSITVEAYDNSWHSQYLTVVSSDPNRLIYSEQEKGFRGNYMRENVVDDPSAEHAALNAGREFVDFIQNDYGGLLYAFIERNAAEGERREAIRAFLEQNKPRIKAWFAAIDANYAAVSLMNKISMLNSFKGVYDKVNQIERSVVKMPSMTLDRVVKAVSGKGNGVRN